MDGVSAMSAEMFYATYSTALMKKSMDNMEELAADMINDMLAAVPAAAPSQYGFDVYG